ncbi:restriction endonuclease [Gilvimarinus polysaccharolyticus]|uniref:restriction endonuclease n=1 Tax=Gilvimarinus polysaccharolyticus TaxID=863921 RepID=UPI000673B080|nr:restriction endonuclease [Gilvimarinus polysaccharolyticus]
MTISWKEYQIQASEFFNRLGFHTEVEAKVSGVRGFHEIDVLVTGDLHGISVKRVIECKNWKHNIPKEKVMALYSIVQDVGADRGFLLSEIGFQSGAIRAAKNSNLTLTSLADLKIEANSTIVENEISSLHMRRSKVLKRLWKLHKSTNDYMSHFMNPMGKLAFIELAVDEALNGNYPVAYGLTVGSERLFVDSWEELINEIKKLLDYAEEYESNYEST